MWLINILRDILIFFGIPAGSVLVLILIFLLALHLYPQFKLVVGDLLKYTGAASKWFRKKSLESEIEGSINSFTKQFNSELTTPFLVPCNVQWVNTKNARSYLGSEKAIVKVSFSDKDHDLNLYVAARAFVEMTILSRAKPFLSDRASKPLDLLILKKLLIVSRRQALRVFNDRFRDEADDVRDRFSQYEETDQKGLFKRILLQEYYFWGESLGHASPQLGHAEEADNFWRWFYDLATRQAEETSNLSFRSANISVGVILVASAETYEQFGYAPYIRRAFTYASNDCKCIYMISRGSTKGRITRDIVKHLVETGCFESLTRVPDVTLYEGPNETPTTITCVALRPNITTIIQKAWQELHAAKTEGRLVHATTKSVSREGITVDVSGLIVQIANENLSVLEITDARKYFRIFDDLELEVLDCDETSNRALLSNRGTATDPRRLLEEFEECVDIPVKATVEHVSRNSEGFESGIVLSFENKTIKGFVPRRLATFSRYQPLTEEYTAGKTIRVIPLKFDASHNSFTCKIPDIKDPWENVHEYQVGASVEAKVREISHFRIICELKPGLEATIPVTELSWQSDGTIPDGRCVDTIIKAAVVRVDPQNRRIVLSPKRLIPSPTEAFYLSNQDKLLKGVIKKVTPRGAVMQIEPGSVNAFMHVSEIMWSYCDDITQILQVGSELQVRPLSYDVEYDNIKVSHKRIYSNGSFEQFREAHKEGDVLIGRPLFRVNGRIIISIALEDKSRFEGYIHKTEISNVCPIDDALFANVFSFNREYHFVVGRIEERYHVIELSRKKYFRAQIGNIKAKNVYTAVAIHNTDNGVYMHGDDIEGFLRGHSKEVKVGSGIIYNVQPVTIDCKKGLIELRLS